MGIRDDTTCGGGVRRDNDEGINEKYHQRRDCVRVKIKFKQKKTTKQKEKTRR